MLTFERRCFFFTDTDACLQTISERRALRELVSLQSRRMRTRSVPMRSMPRIWLLLKRDRSSWRWMKRWPLACSNSSSMRLPLQPLLLFLLLLLPMRLVEAKGKRELEASARTEEHKGQRDHTADSIAISMVLGC